MDKALVKHKAYIAERIEQLISAQAAATSAQGRDAVREQARNLAAYHDQMTRNFQHERQIHLYVTLFFATMTIGCLVAAVFVSQISAAVFIPLAVLTLLLFVLEAFYIRHYYVLENQTQKLYPLAKRLYDLIAD